MEMTRLGILIHSLVLCTWTLSCTGVCKPCDNPFTTTQSQARSCQTVFPTTTTRSLGIAMPEYPGALLSYSASPRISWLPLESGKMTNTKKMTFFWNDVIWLSEGGMSRRGHSDTRGQCPDVKASEGGLYSACSTVTSTSLWLTTCSPNNFLVMCSIPGGGCLGKQ